jgi:hypothetical protein
MPRTRWLFFFLSILVGIGIGVLFGWVLVPTQFVDTQPATLRIDYQTDYVLMVAEAFNQDADLTRAVERLLFFDGATPGETVQQALLFAEPRYADSDLVLMRKLLQAVAPLDAAGQERKP